MTDNNDFWSTSELAHNLIDSVVVSVRISLIGQRPQLGFT